YHFGDWMQYVDGRSPDLTELFRRTMERNLYPAVIWSDEKLSGTFPQYRLVPMKQSPPSGFYPVYLYVLDKRMANNLESARASSGSTELYKRPSSIRDYVNHHDASKDCPTKEGLTALTCQPSTLKPN